MNESIVFVGLWVSLGVSWPQLRSLAFRNLAEYTQTYRYIHARQLAYIQEYKNKIKNAKTKKQRNSYNR